MGGYRTLPPFHSSGFAQAPHSSYKPHRAVRSYSFPMASTDQDGSWPIRAAILRARMSLANMRLDEASKAISRLNRLLNTCPHAHFVRYAVALRLLRAIRLALADDLEGAGHLLATLPPPGPNSVAATILRYADWRSGECELLAPDT